MNLSMKIFQNPAKWWNFPERKIPFYFRMNIIPIFHVNSNFIFIHLILKNVKWFLRQLEKRTIFWDWSKMETESKWKVFTYFWKNLFFCVYKREFMISGSKMLVEYEIIGENLTVTSENNVSTATFSFLFKRRMEYHLANTFFEVLFHDIFSKNESKRNQSWRKVESNRIRTTLFSWKLHKMDLFFLVF